MKQLVIQGSGRRGKSGQMLPFIALWLVALIGFAALSIDLGFAYVTKGRLSKAADAAALAGMRNINQGITIAGQIAQATFFANYAGGTNRTSIDTAAVEPHFTFNPANDSATQLTVFATTSIRTFFSPVLGLIGSQPDWSHLAVGNSSVVSRAHIDITLVLDKSGSLAVNGGDAKMRPAVTTFLSFFSDTLDQMAMVTFSNVAKVNVPMTSPFSTKIDQAVYSNYVFHAVGGGTDSPAGMTNGLAIENAIVLPATSNLVKAVVFFTDGKANEVQSSKTTCTSSRGAKVSNVDLIMGGYDDPSACIDYFDTAGNRLGTGPASCGTYCEAKNDSTKFACLHCAGGFYTITAANIRSESQDRCITYAQQLRDNHTVVCTIGLGKADTDIDVNFLQIMANDPNSDGYLATGYDGIYVPATDSTQMVAAFQRVAENLLDRLIR